MSPPGFLERLLDGAEVAWMPLGDEKVGFFTRGGGLQKKDFVETGVGCIHYGQVYTHYGIAAYETKSFVSEEFAKKARMAKSGDLIIATTSENDEDVCKAVAWLGDSDIAISSDACFYTHNLNPKYVSYFFQSEQFQQQKRQHITGAKVRRVNASSLAKIEIPIPCPENPKKSLEIQAEIVRIFDTFTELTTELTTELEARKKQYNHYRNQLLTFDEGVVEWKTLGEVAEIGTGSRNTQDALQDGEFVFYARGREPLKLNAFDFDETAIITAGDGAGVGKVFHYAQGKFALHQRAYRIVPTEVMNPRFVYHCISSQFYDYIMRASVSSSVTSLRRPMFLNFPIPVPPLAEQARIAAILDKFDTLTTSLTEGLPREIELREKQYAYYRDLLFSFPKPETQAA